MTSAAPAPAVNVFVVGTRAQLIKLAPVIVACEARGLSVLLLLSGQHKETMQDLVLEFGIRSPQEAAVEVGEHSTVLALLGWIPRAYAGLSGRLKALKRQHGKVNVVAHGDTMSTVLSALAARRRGIPVFHVESGLTSGKLFDPFPEELSRRIVFHLTDVALCPSAAATKLMRRYRCRAVDTGGNTIEDAVLLALRDRSASPYNGDRPYLVASLHRFQNIFDAHRLAFLVALLEQLAVRYRIHFVLHPATRKRLEAGGYLARLGATEGIVLTPRLGYRDFLVLAAGATCVLTDGGSNQEELAVLGVPTVVMRKHTERADGLGASAVMEGEVAGGIADYMQRGAFIALRRPPVLRTAMGPSERVAEELAR